MSAPPSSRHRTAAVVLFVCSALAVQADAPPAPYVQPQGSARATVEGGTVQNGAVQVPLSGTLEVTLAVEGGPSLEVAPLATLPAGEAWTTRQPVPPPQRTTLADGHTRWQQTFTVEPIKPGDAGLQLPPLRFRGAPDAGWQTVPWAEVPVRVTTDVGSADLKDLRDILPPERPPEPPRWPWWPFWVGPLLLLGTLTAVVWLLLPRPRKEAVPVSPHAWALEELDRLETLDLPARGEVNRYHTLLSDIVRRYLELRFQIRAPHQTTVEFLQAMQAAPPLGPAEQELLREFLGRCDLAKFAGAIPTGEECQAAADMARAFVERTASAAAPAAHVPERHAVS